MSKIGDHVQSADWKAEKHVPVIEVMEPVKKGEPCQVQLSVGAEIAHPHTTEHHIRYIQLFFKPEGEKFLVHMGTFQFEAHGESVEGANAGSAKCEPKVTATVTLEKPGELVALSYCNIHGLWDNSEKVSLA
ncbi:MAG: class II SORL domain-containing protein [Dethiobacteria bacterium]|nr:class II SORL domain-containing protein [Bacillota bacterium]MDW7729561.1 class II SORL domain-containing protein [Bacillota bacterium]